jgi:hypothetical protein
METRDCFLHGDYTGKSECPECVVIRNPSAGSAPQTGEKKPMPGVTCLACGGGMYHGERCRRCCPTCSTCSGDGTIIINADGNRITGQCPVCEGKGYFLQPSSLTASDGLRDRLAYEESIIVSIQNTHGTRGRDYVRGIFAARREWIAAEEMHINGPGTLTERHDRYVAACDALRGAPIPDAALAAAPRMDATKGKQG